jgi:hypothetical protein
MHIWRQGIGIASSERRAHVLLLDLDRDTAKIIEFDCNFRLSDITRRQLL